MLQSLLNSVSGFFVKLLLGLLVASFALWGIGDIFRSSSSSAIIQVGDTSIHPQEFRDAMNAELVEYRRILGRQYSPELLKTLGVPQQVLAKLVEQKLVEEETRTSGVVVPDSRLKQELRDNPAFHGENGAFDPQQFKRVLANNGLNEALYLSLLKKEIAADMLLQSAFSGLRVTDTAARAAYLYENEKRHADVLLFSPDLIKSVADPSEAELERYYEENAEKYRAAEYRIFSMAALDSAALEKDMAVSDEDALIEYQSRIDEFREPEKREVRQLLFSEESVAVEAAKALASGKTMEEVAQAFGALNETLLLGNVTASGIMPEAEKTVFSLEKNAYSSPIRSSFGWHIFQVTGITPERTRPLAEVKEELVAAIRSKRVGEEVYELSNTLQDDLAGGASLEEAARGVGAKVQTFGPVAKDGTAPDGTAVTLPKGYDRLLPMAFELQEGETSQLMESDQGAYYALRVESVQPERTRALDEIKGAVIDGWKKQQRNKNLYKLASGVASTLAGEDIAKVASTTGAQLMRAQQFARGMTQFSDNRQIPAIMLTALFSAEPGAATEAFALSDGSYIVARLTAVEKADPESAEGRKGLERARENLRALYSDEFYKQYMAYLRDKHGVSEPNAAIIDSLIQ